MLESLEFTLDGDEVHLYVVLSTNLMLLLAVVMRAKRPQSLCDTYMGI